MKTIGFIGLGLMGQAMAKNVVSKFTGTVLVYDLNPAAIACLVQAGAKAATSASAIAQQADIIITMVPKSEHVTAVYRDMLPHLHHGQITLDMSTIDPAVSVTLAKQVAETGAIMLDAPVVKSVPAAINGELGIYIGGDQASYQQVRPILAMMGNNQIYLGNNGQGLVMKILHNLLVAGIQNSVNEMLVAADHYGISKRDFQQAVSYGGGNNFYLSSKIDSLIAENYQTAFSLQNMAKDVNIMHNMLTETGLDLPGVQLIKTVYDASLAAELGNEDFCATVKTVAAQAKH